MKPLRLVWSEKYHHLNPANEKLCLVENRRVLIIAQSNEDGFRTNYSKSEFAQYGQKVAVMGDSFVYGLGVRAESTLPERLEVLLRESLGRVDIAVLNAGIVSYSPYLAHFLFSGKAR